MHCELTELAYSYVLGLLDKKEVERYEQHLSQGCAECSHEIARLSKTVMTIADAEPTAPSPAFKEQLFARIKNVQKNTQVWKHWKTTADATGLFTIGANEGEWERTGIEGIAVKKLFADPEKRTVTMLVKMAAGTAYPSHRHAGAEECYVLQGDLHVGDRVLHPGDYQRAGESSIHVKQWTENGCLLFIISSTEDEILE